MTGEVFVDTNVLVYQHDATAPRKTARAAEWLAWLWQTKRGRLSAQVLQEFYATVTRKLRPGLDHESARAAIRPYFAWSPVPVTGRLIEHAWLLEGRFRLSWWDSLIVAAAQQGRCRWLLSEDLSPRQALDGVTVINPFASTPADLAAGSALDG